MCGLQGVVRELSDNKKLPSHLSRDSYLYQTTAYQLRTVQVHAIIETFWVTILAILWLSQYQAVRRLWPLFSAKGAT
jgi:hypothetical protein